MPPQTPEIRWLKPQQTRSQDTHERLCVAAEELLDDKPFDQISVEEIATRAGSSVGGFYARFADKEALFGYLNERYNQELRETVVEMFAAERWRGVGLADRVHALSKFCIPVVRSHRGLFRSILFRLSEAEQHVQADIRNDIIDGIRDSLLECADEMTHPDPALATRLGFFAMIAAIHELVLFDASPRSRSVNVTDDVLAHELAVAFLAYVGACPPDEDHTTETSPTEGLSHAEHS